MKNQEAATQTMILSCRGLLLLAYNKSKKKNIGYNFGGKLKGNLITLHAEWDRWCISIIIVVFCSIAEVLKTFCQQRLPQSSCESSLRITVRRSHIWNDTIKVLKRPNFDITQKISLTFVGESGVDDGGPSREYFRLLMKAIAEQSQILTSGVSRIRKQRVLTACPKKFC